MYRSGDKYYITIFYRTDNSEYVEPIDIPDCGKRCELTKMYALYDDILPKSNETYTKLCSETDDLEIIIKKTIEIYIIL